MPDFASDFKVRLFESAPDALVVFDHQHVIVLANRRAREWFGAVEAGATRPVESLFADSAAVPVDRLLVPSPKTFEAVCRDQQGRAFPVALTTGSLDVEGQQWHLISLRETSTHARMSEELQTRTRQQGGVSELGRLAVSGTEVGQLMTHAVGLLQHALDVEYANVLELLPDGQVEFRAGVGWKEGLIGKRTGGGLDQIPAVEVLPGDKPVIVTDLRTDPRSAEAALLRDHGVVSSLSVGLQGHNRPFGALGVHSTHLRPFTDEDVSFVQAVAHVLSSALERNWFEQRQRERYMQRAEQMAALGQVAAGIAHELRNPLTAIKGLVQVNLRKAAALSVPATDLAVIEHEIRRMERTLQTFLEFARPVEPQRLAVDLVEVIERVLALVIGRAQKQQVELQLQPATSIVCVQGDKDQLQQLLLNLVLNALDAMPQGGTIAIEIRVQEAAVELFLRDNGPGIAPHILPKVFETFVSSKETGVGLGLPVSRRIAEDHGGTLTAYNLPGEGACFVLKLPLLHPESDRSSHAHPARR